MKEIGWKYLVVYCAWIAFEAILIYFLWPETSGRSLEELAFLFEEKEHRQAAATVEKTIQQERSEEGLIHEHHHHELRNKE